MTIQELLAQGKAGIIRETEGLFAGWWRRVYPERGKFVIEVGTPNTVGNIFVCGLDYEQVTDLDNPINHSRDWTEDKQR